MGAAAAATIKSAIANIDPEKVLALSAPPPDAGTPQDPYGPGASIADINSLTGGCLSEFEVFNEQGTGVSGTVYRLTKSESCIERLPGFVGQAVLAVNGKIYRRVQDFAPPPPPPPPDAGTATRPTAPAPPAPVEGGELQYRVTYPGQPLEPQYRINPSQPLQGTTPPDAGT